MCARSPEHRTPTWPSGTGRPTLRFVSRTFADTGRSIRQGGAFYRFSTGAWPTCAGRSSRLTCRSRSITLCSAEASMESIGGSVRPSKNTTLMTTRVSSTGSLWRTSRSCVATCGCLHDQVSRPRHSPARPGAALPRARSESGAAQAGGSSRGDRGRPRKVPVRVSAKSKDRRGAAHAGDGHRILGVFLLRDTGAEGRVFAEVGAPRARRQAHRRSRRRGDPRRGARYPARRLASHAKHDVARGSGGEEDALERSVGQKPVTPGAHESAADALAR